MVGASAHLANALDKRAGLIQANSVKSGIRDRGQWLQAVKIGALIIAGISLVGVMSGVSWYLSNENAAKSLEVLGTEFMSNVPLYLQSSLEHRLEPIRLHQMAQLERIHADGVDMNTWEGLVTVRKPTISFLKSFFKDTKCCYGIFANFALDKAEVAPFGGWRGFLDQHQDNFGDDRAIWDITIADVDAQGNFVLNHMPTKYTNGSRTNPMMVGRLDTETMEPIQGFPIINNGFQHLPMWDGYWPVNPVSGWWRVVHNRDLQPGEFTFSSVFVWKLTMPITLKILGIVPLYENTSIPTDDQLAAIKAGTLQWNSGRRIGVYITGFKLWFLSSYLAELNLKGGFLFLVERATGALIAASDTAVKNIKNADNPDIAEPFLAHESEHPLIQEAATLLAPAGNWMAIPSEATERTLQGKRQFVLTFRFEFHGLDFQGVYTVPRDIIMADLDRNSKDQLLFNIASNMSVSVLLLGILLVWGFAAMKRMRAAAVEQDRNLRQRIADGLNSVRDLGYPMVLIEAKTFASLSLTELQQCHERQRDLGNLNVMDDIQRVRSLRSAGKFIVFFSYQWLAWHLRGPNEVQRERMLLALQQISAKKGVAVEDIFVWLDILSVPQEHEGIKVLAVNSLYVYASVCNALVIIAPDSVHANTGQKTGLHTYTSRVWCRVEQLAAVATHGKDGVYISHADGLENVCEDYLQSVMNIFEGEMSCCRMKHNRSDRCDKETLVTPLLGVWFIILLAQRGFGKHDGVDMLYKLMNANLSSFFPMMTDFVTESGMEQRVLFGDMLKRVQALVDEKSDEELQAIYTDLSVGGGSGVGAQVAAPAVVAKEDSVSETASI